MASEILSAVQPPYRDATMRPDVKTEFPGIKLEPSNMKIESAHNKTKSPGDLFQFQGTPSVVRGRQERRSSLNRWSRQFTSTRPTPAFSHRSCTNQNNEGSSSYDNMLRRKTPNGTLNAAYDGSSTQGSGLPPASKHLLLAAGFHPQQPLLTNARQTSHVPIAKNSNQPSQSFRARMFESSGSWPAMSAWQEACQTQAYSTLPQVDSMLNGSVPHPAAMDWQYSSQRSPNVMQPPYQPPLGPTASHEYTPDEPIWPNGKVAPYQPLPPQPDFQYASRSTNKLPTQSNPNSDWMLISPVNRTFSFDVDPETIPDFDPQRHTQHGCHLHSHGWDSRSWNASSVPFCDTSQHPNVGSFDHVRRHMAYTAHRSLDDALSLGYQMYTALVAAIQGARRIGTPEPKAQSNQTQALLANIFPEPLRKTQIQDLITNSKQSSGRAFYTKSHSSQSNKDPMLCQASLSSLPIPPWLRDSFSHSGPKSYPEEGPGTSPTNQSWIQEPVCAFNRPLGSVEAALAHSSPSDGASIALDDLSTICQQSNHGWTDGMLLCGSLAYALGNYQLAAYWFSSILQVDSCHVEATSNFAATCLALNRRADAEQYWRVAVNARPSYFEAVEHLVGLLCFDRRHKEAIYVIEHVQRALRCHRGTDLSRGLAQYWSAMHANAPLRYKSPAVDNGRLMALLHAKGNILYNMQDHLGAARAFEEVVLIAVNQSIGGIDLLIKNIITSLCHWTCGRADLTEQGLGALLLPPEKAQQTAKLCFPGHAGLPGLDGLDSTATKKAAVSVTSNSLLSLAKIFQDGMNPSVSTSQVYRSDHTIQDILALYYLSLSLQPSPSTANNVGILLASVPQPAASKASGQIPNSESFMFPGVVPGSGVALALTYYRFGLNLDTKHAHLFTNLGSLLKDLGQLALAIQMYERAVSCDANFDIALANLANAVKDQGKVTEAIAYYRRAVNVNPNFAEAVCGLANALNSVCDWTGRGGVAIHNKKFDRWHVDDQGGLIDVHKTAQNGFGWIQRTVDIVDGQLRQGQLWGNGVLHEDYIRALSRQAAVTEVGPGSGPSSSFLEVLQALMRSWQGQRWEGARTVWLVERLIRRCGWQWYQDKYVRGKERPLEAYRRPSLPAALSVPSAPTVLPFHTFTLPMTAKQIRLISQRNGLRVSANTLRAAWLPQVVYKPPAPPTPQLRVGYVSSDFNNHPLAHLMQSVFGMHDKQYVDAHCYATTATDNSVHRQQIENEAPHFCDASTWTSERLINQIVQDGIHILVNLNGYTRGARNEIFAARPVPLQMSFMGFAGTLGAEWCDYLLADETAVPPKSLRPRRCNVDIDDLAKNVDEMAANGDWVYAENIIYTRDTFFCCDHRQSGSSVDERRVSWKDELTRRLEMRRALFPDLPEDAVIFGNFNQLYKIDPTTFRTWLRILSRVPRSYLWLLRFPADGAQHLLRTAQAWAGPSIASRILFTEVAPKSVHIQRACVADLFLDTPECNAHTTAADCLWSGTPLLTLPRYEWKMCSRMAAGIVGGALDRDSQLGEQAWRELVMESEEDYEDTAVRLGCNMSYKKNDMGKLEGEGRLIELREMIWKGRWTCKLFDTKRWVRDLELAYKEAWRRWEAGEGGDIWLKNL